MSRICNRGTGMVVILMLAAGQTSAQLPGQSQQQEQDQQSQRNQESLTQQRASGQEGQLDKLLAKLLVSKNEAAIKINEFAQQQAQDQQVKQYASEMVRAHQQLNQKLQQVAGSSQSGQQSLQQQGQPGDAAEQLVQIFDRTETQFTQSLIEGLRDKQGRQFDNTLMGLEVLGHMRMVESLDVMQQHASSELQQILQQAHKETQKHLQEAEQLSKKMEQTAVAQRPQADQQRQPQ